MVEKTDYIDISPERGGAAGKKMAVFQEDEWKHIMENTGGLTKEGCKEKIKLWKLSSNKHVVLKYETMLARCKEFKPSGKTPDGKIILSRLKDGTPKWVKEDLNPYDVKKEKPVKMETKKNG